MNKKEENSHFKLKLSNIGEKEASDFPFAIIIREGRAFKIVFYFKTSVAISRTNL